MPDDRGKRHEASCNAANSRFSEAACHVKAPGTVNNPEAQCPQEQYLASLYSESNCTAQDAGVQDFEDSMPCSRNIIAISEKRLEENDPVHLQKDEQSKPLLYGPCLRVIRLCPFCGCLFNLTAARED